MLLFALESYTFHSQPTGGGLFKLNGFYVDTTQKCYKSIPITLLVNFGESALRMEYVFGSLRVRMMKKEPFPIKLIKGPMINRHNLNEPPAYFFEFCDSD
ncbi:Oidioi.mRNA.OKI2018_I69.PAR.g13070.t1.cds [Oikopleura dioica]|uniref:Oidioi.mRNA.OKI2018_I69.PAR.g13070.t1.cds n=1 Tax=Oikopleura dioica TaxID=34765 RepID=A0ABN7SAY3_OIKDI|nr:Oidioi.mRNA.OKI2018_I69.PAR.g13070.t1.cds [Oikopleura dioica]